MNFLFQNTLILNRFFFSSNFICAYWEGISFGLGFPFWRVSYPQELEQSVLVLSLFPGIWYSVLCLRFWMSTMLIRSWCFSCGWAVFSLSQRLFISSAGGDTARIANPSWQKGHQKFLVSAHHYSRLRLRAAVHWTVPPFKSTWDQRPAFSKTQQ